MTPELLVSIPDMVLGSDTTPVRIVEYASFTCVYCAAFHDETFENFERDYIDTGRVQLTYREIFYDRYRLWASIVARCAPADRYLGMVDLPFETQRCRARAAGGAAMSEELGLIARVAGLSDERVDACLADAEGAERLMS